MRRTAKRMTFYEWLAGKLLTEAARLRAKRNRADDAHELRHLLAAVTAGNSYQCDKRPCFLTRELLQTLHDGNWPDETP